jgi:hypothetical protein
MSTRNGEKARASIARKRRTNQRVKDRERRAELTAGATTTKKTTAKKSAS